MGVPKLKRDWFGERVNEHGITEYEMVGDSPEQVNENAGRTKLVKAKEEEPKRPF